MSLLDRIGSLPPNFPYTIPSTINPSIDRVVFQIERLGGSINDLSNQVDGMVAQLTDRVDLTVYNIQNEFTSNKTGVPAMLSTITSKFSGWPVIPFIVVVVTGLILIIVSLLFLGSKGAAYFIEKKYKKVVETSPSDIENL